MVMELERLRVTLFLLNEMVLLSELIHKYSCWSELETCQKRKHLEEVTNRSEGRRYGLQGGASRVEVAGEDGGKKNGEEKEVVVEQTRNCNRMVE